MTIYILNGPNLNLLGQRQPEIYGTTTLADIEESCQKLVRAHEKHFVFRQTNHEGLLIDWIHEARTKATALILNAAGLTHTSVSLLDALLTLTIPVYEVHLTQPHRRENFRHTSFVSPAARGIIAGFGADGYIMALTAFFKQHKQDNEE